MRIVSKYAVPDHIFFVDAVPKTSVGKLDKKVMRAKLAEQAAAAASAKALPLRMRCRSVRPSRST